MSNIQPFKSIELQAQVCDQSESHHEDEEAEEQSHLDLYLEVDHWVCSIEATHQYKEQWDVYQSQQCVDN